MNIQTFIFVHNQDIILDFIEHKKFSNLKNLKYVFLGSGEINQILDLENVIIARNLEYNIEQYPKLTSYTGWYSLWKNNLISSDYINLFEYDINITDDIEHKISNLINLEQPKVIGYIPHNIHSFEYLKHSPWSDVLVESLKKVYDVDILEIIKSKPATTTCSMTSNHTFSRETFDQYMIWTMGILDFLKNSPLSGHQIERSISVFYLIHDLKYKILEGSLFHFQFDSHKTQNISQDKFKKNYTELLK